MDIREPMKVISFLGISKYLVTKYKWNGKVQETCFFPEAVAHFIKPEKILICLTPTAREGERAVNWQELKKRFENDSVPYDVLPIPEGHSEPELWEIFNTLTNAVQEKEEVIFDITHSFRSLPFLSFLAIAYLKAAKKVNVKGVLYGAYDAHDENNYSPVFDLTPFVSLLDWLTATEQFIQTGNARSLSGLLNPQKKKEDALYQAATTLDTISQAARLCQPFTLMKEVGGLEKKLTQAQQQLQISAPPFGVLRNQITSAFGQFENDGQDVAEMLRTEFRLVNWYYQKGQIIQAVTLAREWLIDAVTYRLGEPLDYLLDKRNPFEKAISGVALLGKPHPDDRDRIFNENDLNRFGLELLKWKELDTLQKVWTDLKNVRNPLDHAEHQRKKEKEKTLQALNKLQKKIDTTMKNLQTLAEEWSLV